MMRMVRFEEFGDLDKLKVADVDEPHAGRGQIRVHVQYAGLNPVDWKILAFGNSGMFGATAPSGNGNDFAGVIDEVGEDVDGLTVGTAVYGGKRFFAQADYVVVTPEDIHVTPTGLGSDVAATLEIAARTAAAGIRKLHIKHGETVFVGAAAGGVGIIAAQLAVKRGARVIGTASESNHEFLRQLGIAPTTYGEGLEHRLKELAPQGIDAAFSTQHRDEIELLIKLGVAPKRINSIGAGDEARALGASTAGGADAVPEDVENIATGLADGRLVLPIDSVYALTDVQAAYARLKAGHVRGKIILRTADSTQPLDRS